MVSAPVTPPGEVTEVSARSVLVVAPHYDDEVLGCGGLLAALIEGGVRANVLFLSDGAGGIEGADDPAAYSERRRQEADAVAALFGFAATHLDLPDGQLQHRIGEIRAAFVEALAEHQPDLLLVPSPLEVTPDHQAAFAAVHEVLSSRRDAPTATDPGLAGAGPVVLTYEVNHPHHPDLLVDVGTQIDRLREAMALYASQQERHDYLSAALGLRQYRTHTLAPEVEAAEGYRRLDLDDFRTRSLVQLVRHLGGAPQNVQVSSGPLVSVIVRTRDRPDLLREAVGSLAESTYRKVEVIVVNDGGAPVDLPTFDLQVQMVALPENQGRAAAADAGIRAACGELVGFLDDDDLVAPEHIATLVAAHKGAGVRLAYSDAAVTVYELDPQEGGFVCRERRLPYSRDFDRIRLLVDNYIPFNTVLVEKSLLEEVRDPSGRVLDHDLLFFEDWDLLIRLAQRVNFHHLPRVTCEYRHFRGADHHVLGGGQAEATDFERDFVAMRAKLFERHAALLDAPTLARAITDMRAEAVATGEALRTARTELEAERRERLRLTDQAQRFYDNEASMRSTIDDQTEHLGRTYGEIERLQGIIAAMERTRAWRWHQRIERWKGRG